MDFFTVPTLGFQILYILVILNHSRRQVVHFAVTAHPTMAWVIQQLREAMPFGQQPSYLFRDNDGIYGDEVGRFLVGTGVAEVKTAHRCPWQNPFVERYGGTLRRELLDHVMILNEEHLKRLLKEFIEGYYHRARPHQGLHGDTPALRHTGARMRRHTERQSKISPPCGFSGGQGIHSSFLTIRHENPEMSTRYG